ncbi:hypothetical protein HK102_008404, partial [Quaeritorhiza haematococci]
MSQTSSHRYKNTFPPSSEIPNNWSQSLKDTSQMRLTPLLFTIDATSMYTNLDVDGICPFFEEAGLPEDFVDASAN